MRRLLWYGSVLRKFNSDRYHRKCVCWADEWAALTMDDIRLMEDKVQKKLRKFWRDKRIEEGLEVPDDSDSSEVDMEVEDTPKAEADASPGSTSGRSRSTSRLSTNKDTTGLLTVTASPVDPARTSVSASVNNDISIIGASAKANRKAGVDVMRAGSLFKLGDGIINTSWNERYFVLSGSVLSYYRDSRELRPKDSISMKGAVVQWCGSHKGREHAFIVMPRDNRRQIVVSGGSEGETRQWMLWCQEAADKATATTSIEGSSPKAVSAATVTTEDQPREEEAAKVEAGAGQNAEVEQSDRAESVEEVKPTSAGGLLPDECTRYLPKEALRGVEGLLRFVRCGNQRNDMCVVSTDKGLRLWREVERGREEASFTVLLSKIWSEATRVDFYSIPLSIAFAITTGFVFILSVTGAFLTPLAALTLTMWLMSLRELLPVIDAVQQGTCSGVVVGEVSIPTTSDGLIEAALLDLSEWHRWTPALHGDTAARLSCTGLVMVKYRGQEMVEHIIRPVRRKGTLPSLVMLHYSQKRNDEYTCWAVYPQSSSVSVMMAGTNGPGKSRRTLTFIREFLSGLQLVMAVCPRPRPSLPDLAMPRGSEHIHATRRGSGGWVELPVPFGVAGLDSALKTALLHNSEEAVVGGRLEGEDAASVMPTLMAMSYMFLQSSVYMPRASTAVVNNDAPRALQLVAASLVGSLQRLLCALQSSDAFLTTTPAAAAASKAVIIPGDTCQCRATPRGGGRGGQGGAEICWEAINANHAYYLVTEEKGNGQWTQRGTIKYGVSLLPPSLRHRTTGIVLNLTGPHYIDFLSSDNGNIAAERSNKRSSNKAVTARVTELPKLVCRPLSGSSKRCLLRWEGCISISIPGDTGGTCKLSIADPSTGLVTGSVRNGRGALHSYAEGNIFDRLCFDGEPLWVSGELPDDLVQPSEETVGAFPPRGPLVEIKVEPSKRLLPTDCHSHHSTGRSSRVSS
ncbi:hypothetical protein FOZ62_003415 [Perkinsus olseni]|uniref:PH domain-containing protein n=1 Tax=Perkinsus olseni TaxID=32597 RepID=A0A7J6TL91_PEROL|nr:hypothetical protein FOZ62_003415 [Perkinsus olseni]